MEWLFFKEWIKTGTFLVILCYWSYVVNGPLIYCKYLLKERSVNSGNSSYDSLSLKGLAEVLVHCSCNCSAVVFDLILR